MNDNKREIWIDWMRVTACFFVMLTHCCEPFYLGGEGSLILTKSDAIWVSILNVLPRACVALFIMASSYLQFPLHYDTQEFFRRRAGRILIPFLFWTIVYALIWGEPVQNFKDLLLNFNYSAGRCLPPDAVALAMGGKGRQERAPDLPWHMVVHNSHSSYQRMDRRSCTSDIWSVGNSESGKIPSLG